MVDSLLEGLRTTALGMGVVFVSLAALYFVMAQMGRLFARPHVGDGLEGQAAHDGPSGSVSRTGRTDGEPEVAAVVAAVMSAMGSVGGRIRIKTISRADR